MTNVAKSFVLYMLSLINYQYFEYLMRIPSGREEVSSGVGNCRCHLLPLSLIQKKSVLPVQYLLEHAWCLWCGNSLGSL